MKTAKFLIFTSNILRIENLADSAIMEGTYKIDITLSDS